LQLCRKLIVYLEVIAFNYHQILRQLLPERFRQEQGQDPTDKGYDSQDDHGDIVVYPTGKCHEGTEEGGRISHDMNECHAFASHHSGQQFRRELQRDVVRNVDEEPADYGER